MHYYRVKRGGTPFTPISKKNVGAFCSIKDCMKIQICNTFCGMHNRRYRVHGDPNYTNPNRRYDGKYRERHKLYQKEWRKRNWDRYKAYLANAKKRVKQATPKWVDKSVLIAFYLARPAGHHVDHIVPICGKNVCGLHVPWNLQYLPILDNLKKHNSY